MTTQATASTNDIHRSTTLFRQEVLDAKNTHFLGSIRVARRPSFLLVTCAALLIGASLLAFAIFGEATRKAQVSGVLMPEQGLLNLSSPQAGSLTELFVKEGDMVESDQLLAVLYIGGASTKGNTAKLIAQSLTERRLSLEAERRNAKAQAQQRQIAMVGKLRSLQVDITQAEGELEATHHRQQFAQRTLERERQLATQGFMSDAQVQIRQEESLDVQVRERTARRNLEGLKREAQGVIDDMRASDLQAQDQQNQLTNSLASLTQEDTENSARAEWTLRAPKAGTISSVNSHIGQGLLAGQTLLSMVPVDSPGNGKIGSKDASSASLQAQLYAPSRTIGFVESGQQVWIRLQAYPYQKFGMIKGLITAVSRTPVNPPDLPSGLSQVLLFAAGVNEPLYRITVSLDTQGIDAYGQAQPLKAGMTLDADIIQDRRSILDWILDPLIAARSRINPSENPTQK